MLPQVPELITLIVLDTKCVNMYVLVPIPRTTLDHVISLHRINGPDLQLNKTHGPLQQDCETYNYGTNNILMA